MEAQYKTANGRLTVKLDAQDIKALFRQLAQFQGAFEAETECGLCKSKDVTYNVRVHDDSEYFELVCSACGAQFGFGQHKKGATLFAKRKNDKGGNLPARGWYKWTGNSQQQGGNSSYDGGDDDAPF